MKRFYWMGLLVGCLSSLLVTVLLWASAPALAQSLAAPVAQDTNPGDEGLVPQGGGGPGPVDTFFTYQGVLKKNGTPVNGYCDMQFKLFDQDTPPGNQKGSTINLPNTKIENGIFTVVLDFHNQFYGFRSYLETGVSCPTSSSPSYSVLPRQLLSAAPYALSLRPGATMIGSVPGSDAFHVENNAPSSTGIYGHVINGRGVVGFALADSGYAIGIQGISYSPDGAGVAAQGFGTGAALRLAGGNIKVDYAGINSQTPVFIHQVSRIGTGSTICNGQVYQTYSTVINNDLINGNPNAILVVTPNFGSNDGSGMAPTVGIPAVYYDASGSCGKGAGRWVIYNLNEVAQIHGARFNVMAVVP